MGWGGAPYGVLQLAVGVSCPSIGTISNYKVETGALTRQGPWVAGGGVNRREKRKDGARSHKGNGTCGAFCDCSTSWATSKHRPTKWSDTRSVPAAAPRRGAQCDEAPRRRRCPARPAAWPTARGEGASAAGAAKGTLTTPDGNKDWEQLPAGERRNRAHSSLDGGMTAREVEMGISRGGKKRPVLRRLKSWDTNGGGASGLLVYNSQGKEVSLPSSLPALLCQDPQDNTMKHSMLKLVGGTALLRAAESSEILDVHQSGMETRVDLVATTARGGRKKSARAPIPSLYQSDISSTGKRPPTKTLFLSPIQRDKPLSGFGPDIDDGGSLQPQRVGSLPVMVDATNGVLVATTKHEEKGEDVTVNMMVPLY
eukprot:CAMPEP_0194570592 /NCGR_PEP_ID=MMETSP0292-20121207/7853_1 /TAXON_ID=39354 /ORGANISM="Heterosigma akashiwo, Strain CCMP2393" /LENGTH=368 /DNA_ID=CAMNT_0039421087 /DNA_START=2010 /DNA_END=3115 /DNA_ORIENTATION=-